MSSRLPRQPLRRLVVCLWFLLAEAIFMPVGVSQTTTPLFPVEPSFTIDGGNGILSTTSLPGDLNGDGLLDSVILFYNNGNVSNIVVLLSNKNSTPTQVLTAINCGFPHMAVADINEDQKLDVVLSCGGNYVEVFLGNGDGTFQTSILNPTSAVPAAPILADFNGDGLPDLAYSTGLGSAIALNLGKGTFGPSQTTAFAGLGVLASGDFNGDGKQDLIVGDIYGSAAFALGKGDATFATPQPLPANVYQPVVGDFNHDGYFDVAYFSAIFNRDDAYPFNSNVVVLLGGPNGLAPTGQSIATNGSVFSFLTAVDLTGSGNLDLVLQNNTGLPNAQPSNTLVLLGDGQGNFSAPRSYTGYMVSYIVDVNGDGLPDLVGVDDSTGTSILSYAAGLGDGTFRALINTPNGQSPQTISVADLNGDGLADAILYDPKGVPAVFLSQGDGRFIAVPNALPAAPGFIVTADFNGDGKIDVASISPGIVGMSVSDPAVNGAIAVYTGNGDGTLNFKQQASIAYPGITSAVAGDFNGDQKQDLVLLTYSVVTEALAAVFLPGNGDGSFGVPMPITLLDQSDADLRAPLQATDLNGDGFTDLIIGGGSYLGNASGTFPPLQLLPGGGGLVAALAGNSTLDLLTTGGGVYAANAEGMFDTGAGFGVGLTNGSLYSVAIGGLGGNGFPDVASTQGLTSGPATLNVFLNQGGSFVSDPIPYFAGEYFDLEGTATVGYDGNSLALVRLNANSPASGSTQRLDALLYTSGGLTSMLNQLNPAPRPAATVIVSLADGLTSIVTGTAVTVNAALSAPGAAAPTGTITFFAGSVQLGSSAVTGGNATITAPVVGTGAIVIRAVYSGDATYGPSTGFASLTVSAPVASTTTLTASAINVNEQQPVSFTATIQGNAPTGMVTFLNGSTTLGTAVISGGAATFTTSFASAGSVPVTASYAGDPNNLASSSIPLVIAVVAPGFAITASPASATVAAGQSATYTLTVTPSGGFANAVGLTCGTLPSEATCSFSAATVTPMNGQPASVKLTITTMAAATGALQRRADVLPRSSPWFPAGAVITLASLFGFMRRSFRTHRWQLMNLIGLAALCIGSFAGCGGGSSSPTPPSNPGTPAGTSTVTISAAASGITSPQTVNLQLVVQ